MDSGIYLTEDEPDRKSFGTRRHWFGKPSTKGLQHTALKNLNAYPTTSPAVSLAPDGFL